MIRDSVAAQLDHDPHFRWRGETVTRIENLSDIVFALALGMLVSASEIPKNWDQLNAHLINIVPVALGFMLMLAIWNAHFTFFRRYGVGDKWIIILNAALLLVILYIAYPLRFMFDGLFAYVQGATSGDWTRMRQLGFIGFDGAHQAARLTAYFAIGYSVLNGLILAMYSHALRKADLLHLTRSERVMTLRSIWRYCAEVLLGVLASLCALYTAIGPFAGFMLTLILPVSALIKRVLKLPVLAEEEADLA